MFVDIGHTKWRRKNVGAQLCWDVDTMGKSFPRRNSILCACEELKRPSENVTDVITMENRWSYDTRGKLIKAPEFENIPDFDKAKNSLWKVNLEIRDGLVFINMESKEDSQNLEPTATGTIPTNPDSKNLKCAVEWKMDGRFNWKLAGKLETLS